VAAAPRSDPNAGVASEQPPGLVLRRLVAEDNGEEQEVVACPACRADDSVLELETVDWLMGKAGTYRVVRCGRCELRFLNPRPAPEALGAHYPDNYFCYTNFEGEHGLFRRMMGDLQRKLSFTRLRNIERAIGRLSRESEVLDVGCGRGDLLDCLRRERGCRVLGIDFNAKVAQVVKQQLGIDVLTGTLLSATLEAARFDLVIMAEYLEHEPDPQRILSEALRVLRPGGHIGIEVPDISGPPSRLFGRFWWQLDAPRHLMFFTPATLAKMLEGVGFEIVRVRRFGRFGSMGYSLLQRLGYRYAGSNPFVYLSLVLLLSLPFAPFMFLLPDFMFIIAKKPLVLPSAGTPTPR
jgi:SAM-dependent methyltransferase